MGKNQQKIPYNLTTTYKQQKNIIHTPHLKNLKIYSLSQKEELRKLKIFIKNLYFFNCIKSKTIYNIYNAISSKERVDE